MSIRIPLLALMLVSLAVGTVPRAAAPDCMRDLASANEFLQQLQGRVGEAREANRPRVRAFLAEARKLIDAALPDCRNAKGPGAVTAALAKIALAQGNLQAARLFIVAD